MTARVGCGKDTGITPRFRPPPKRPQKKSYPRFRNRPHNRPILAREGARSGGVFAWGGERRLRRASERERPAARTKPFGQTSRPARGTTVPYVSGGPREIARRHYDRLPGAGLKGGEQAGAANGRGSPFRSAITRVVKSLRRALVERPLLGLPDWRSMSARHPLLAKGTEIPEGTPHPGAESARGNDAARATAPALIGGANEPIHGPCRHGPENPG